MSTPPIKLSWNTVASTVRQVLEPREASVGTFKLCMRTLSGGVKSAKMFSTQNHLWANIWISIRKIKYLS